MEEHIHRQWRARLKKRRGKTFSSIAIRELNLVAMMDMMTIILVFLLKSYSVSALSIPVGEQINVPKSSNLISPPEAVKLTVTKVGTKDEGVIAVDQDKVMHLDSKTVASLQAKSEKRDFLIPELETALKKKAESIKYIASKNPQVKFDGRILVIADKDTPYWLVTQILFTAAEAEFEQYKLVAMKLEQN